MMILIRDDGERRPKDDSGLHNLVKLGLEDLSDWKDSFNATCTDQIT